MNATNEKAQQILKVSAAALIAVIVLLAHLYLPSQASALASETIRSLHGPGFGIVALMIMKLMRRGARSTGAYIRAATFAMLLAVISEAAQIPGPREAQVSDLFIDALGVLGFLGTAAVLDRGVRAEIGKRRIVLLSVISTPALVFTLLPTLWLSYALVMREQALPQVLTFDEVWERAYSSGEGARPELIPAPTGWPEGSGNIARLRSAGQWSLMLHIYPHPDWSQYGGISFVAATTDGESRRIALGFWGIVPGDGTLPGRYYTTKMVGPDPARYCVSFDDLRKSSTDREFDLTHVYELLLGATKYITGEELLVDDFRLEKLAKNCPARKSNH